MLYSKLYIFILLFFFFYMGKKVLRIIILVNYSSVLVVEEKTTDVMRFPMLWRYSSKKKYSMATSKRCWLIPKAFARSARKISTYQPKEKMSLRRLGSNGHRWITKTYLRQQTVYHAAAPCVKWYGGME